MSWCFTSGINTMPNLIVKVEDVSDACLRLLLHPTKQDVKTESRRPAENVTGPLALKYGAYWSEGFW
jgi:hypothetical protein